MFELFFKEDLSSNDSEKLESDEESQVIIRFEKKDFKISQKLLKNCKYFRTMMNSNWKDFNQKENDCIVLDLTLIQNEIFQFSEQVDIYEIFEQYIEYLTNGIIPTDLEMKLKLIELARYLQDGSYVLKIVQDANLLLKLYILSIFEIVEPVHSAIASCFLTDCYGFDDDTSNEVPLKVLERIFNNVELSPLAMKKISELGTQLNSKTIIKDENIIQLSLSNFDSEQKVMVNNQEVSITLDMEGFESKAIYTITTSRDIEIFGNAKFYIQFNGNCYTCFKTGFWIENKQNGKMLFKLPNFEFVSIDILIILCTSK